jgi:hypothetical protein
MQCGLKIILDTALTQIQADQLRWNAEKKMEHAGLLQNYMWRKKMNKIVEAFRSWLSVLVFGEIPHGKPLPKHVQDVKINQDFMALHMRCAETPPPPRYREALENEVV